MRSEVLAVQVESAARAAGLAVVSSEEDARRVGDGEVSAGAGRRCGPAATRRSCWS